MANRSIPIMDLLELVRLLRQGASDRTLTRVLRHNRRTIAKYREWAAQQGLLQGELPTAAQLQARHAATLPALPPPQQRSSVEGYREEIAALRERGLEAAAIRVRLEERHGHPVSYSAVWRLLQRLRAEEGATTHAHGQHGGHVVVRVEVPPGSEAQVDFGYAGLCVDPRSGAVRKTWVFVMVLAFSRHLYAELVFDQRVETWLLCHAHAFAFFGGVPARVVPDNLKAAVVRVSFTEPEAQRAYRECAEHYSFLIDPNPPRSPHLKGKVEQGGVHYVKRNFLAGRCALDSPPQALDTLNAGLRRWCVEVASRRTHGTTKQQPLERFCTVEQPALHPLPPAPYLPAVWKRVTVYRDCYVTFAGAYYSAPYRLVGQALWLRAGACSVELYNAQHELVATHDRAAAPGERMTHLVHLPPEKVTGLTLTRETCRAQAAAIGPATAALVETLLDHRPEDRLRSAGRLLRLATQTSPARLEQACARAQAYGSADYPSVKRILAAGLEQLEQTQQLAQRGWVGVTPEVTGPASPGGRPYTFMRQASEFVLSLLAGHGASGASGPAHDPPDTLTTPVANSTSGTGGSR